MPSILLTTSRKTSNRVRTFIRDLASVLPGVERFNRGGMGLSELIARISQSGAQFAAIISTWRGNPGEMVFLSPQGDETLNIHLESVMLRREVNPSGITRNGHVDVIIIKSECSENVRLFANDLASAFHLEIVEKSSRNQIQRDESLNYIWLDDIGAEKIIWTHYDNLKDIEIGPRIRITHVRRLIRS